MAPTPSPHTWPQQTQRTDASSFFSFCVCVWKKAYMSNDANLSSFLFFFWWKKAYMSIDANYISNPKDR